MVVIQFIARMMRPILEFPLVKRIRRNHGFEHATIHTLNRQNYILSGRASAGGFAVYGDVPTAKVEAAAQEALRRLKSGQSQLALHPNCGTNLVTSGLLTTLIAAIGFTGTNRKAAWDRFPFVLLFMMATSLYATPIGMVVQKYITTEGDPGDLEVIAVKRSEMRLLGKLVYVHQIYTRNG